MGWPKGKSRKGIRAVAPPAESGKEGAGGEDFKLTPPEDKKKKPKKDKPAWSGIWVEKETTRIDRKNGGKTCSVLILANLSNEIDELEGLFKEFEEAEISVVDGSLKAFAAFTEKSTKAIRNKPGASVLHLKLEGTASFEKFIGRNVTLKGRQKKIPTGEHQGEPR